jgi:hypothetical protein
MSTAPRCVTNLGSGRSTPQHFLPKLVTRSASRSNPNLRGGAAPSLCHRVKAEECLFVTRLDFGGNRRINSVLYIASVTQQRDVDEARVCIDRKTGEGKTRREARRHTSGTSPTGSSDACGKTKNYASISPIKLLLDKGASDSPLGTAFDFRCECF